ncbi:MAG TPA: helix-turn-helix domain-containing protein [Terriglobia bacterium]|nr:helix-turn-helix domain-containing protein [Terriglobia bacterium]
MTTPARSSDGRLAGRFCRVRTRNSAGTSPRRLGARPPVRPTPDSATHRGPHADQVRKLYSAGTSKSEIAHCLNIGLTSVRRMLASNRDEIAIKKIWLPQDIAKSR